MLCCTLRGGGNGKRNEASLKVLNGFFIIWKGEEMQTIKNLNLFVYEENDIILAQIGNATKHVVTYKPQEFELEQISGQRAKINWSDKTSSLLIITGKVITVF